MLLLQHKLLTWPIFLQCYTGAYFWYLCVLMSQEINLNHLWVSGNLLHVFCSSLWTFDLLGKLSYCTGWKLTQFHVVFIQGFRHKLLIIQEEPENVPL